MRRVAVYKDKRNRVIEYEGAFHGWSQEYEEFESGPGNYTVAVVELDTGEVILPEAYLIKFCEGE